MELIVFDLDGTLLDSKSTISDYTRNTLNQLASRNIAYTVATGRTLHAARDILDGHQFVLPQIFKNGVLIWHPQVQTFSDCNLLTPAEVNQVVQAFVDVQVTPFIFTLEGENDHAVYHPALLRTDQDKKMVREFRDKRRMQVRLLSDLPGDARITNVSAIGHRSEINQVQLAVDAAKHLVAYSGTAVEDQQLLWLDIHHSDASKGGAISVLKETLGVKRVVCFGDNHNDLSMFALADESYAPDNADDSIKSAATAVIGHHDEDGIARFLRERFSLADE